MSAKQPNVEIQPSPRIPAREMMVTRRRSAQMKHQLRVKDRSMTKITQLLRSPTKVSGKKSKSKTKKASTLKSKSQKVEKKTILKVDSTMSRENSPKSIITMDSEEFCPHIKKRVYNKKTFLKVQNKLQMIGDVNSVSRRKTCLPRKGTTSPTVFCRATPERKISTPMLITKKFEPTIVECKSQSPVYAELSMQEVMRITEDTEKLTDEDFLEILTCPSPVWWEDPPGDAYIEEAICSRKPLNIEPVVDKNMVVPKNVNTQLVDNISNTISTIEADSFNKKTNFIKPPDLPTKQSDEGVWMKKRTKLENILGCVKNKIANSNNIPQPSDYLPVINNLSDQVVDYTNPILDVAVTNSVLNNTEDIQNISKDTLTSCKIARNLNSCIKRVSESTDTDASEFSIDDEIVKNLENMFIPIAERSSSDVERSESTNSDCVPIENEVSNELVKPCDTSNKNELQLKTRSESNRKVVSKGNDNISQTLTDTQHPNENRDIIDLEDLITLHKLDKKHTHPTKPSPKNENDTGHNPECERVSNKKKKLKKPSISKKRNRIQPSVFENTCVNVNKYDIVSESSTIDMNEVIYSNSDTNVKLLFKNNEFNKSRVNMEQNIEKYLKSDEFFVNNDLVNKSLNEKDYCDLHIHSISKDTSVRNDDGKGLKNCVTIHEILAKIDKETSEAEIQIPTIANKLEKNIYDENLKIKGSETGLEILAKIESDAKVQAYEIPNKVATVTNKDDDKNNKVKNKRLTIQEILLEMSKETDSDVKVLAAELANKIDTKNTREEDKNKKLNSFYKKCKYISKQQKKSYNQGKRNMQLIWRFKEENSNRRRIADEPRTDLDCAPSTSGDQNELCETCSIAENNAIAVPGYVKSKYCFICSSIYGTQHCEYCRQLPTVWH